MSAFLRQAGEWLHAEVPCISVEQAAKLMDYVHFRRTVLKASLSPTELRWMQAWDHLRSEADGAKEEKAS